MKPTTTTKKHQRGQQWRRALALVTAGTMLSMGCSVNKELQKGVVRQPRVISHYYEIHEDGTDAAQMYVWTDGEKWQAVLDPVPLCTMYADVKMEIRDWEQRRLRRFDRGLAAAGYAVAAAMGAIFAVGLSRGSKFGPSLATGGIYILPPLALGVIETVRAKDRLGDPYFLEEAQEKGIVPCPVDVVFPTTLKGSGAPIPFELGGEWRSIPNPVTGPHIAGIYRLDTAYAQETIMAELDMGKFEKIGKLVDDEVRALTPRQIESYLSDRDPPFECRAARSFLTWVVPQEFFEQDTYDIEVKEDFRLRNYVAGGFTYPEFVRQTHLLNRELFKSVEGILGKTLRLPTVNMKLSEWEKKVPELCRDVDISDIND